MGVELGVGVLAQNDCEEFMVRLMGIEFIRWNGIVFLERVSCTSLAMCSSFRESRAEMMTCEERMRVSEAVL